MTKTTFSRSAGQLALLSSALLLLAVKTPSQTVAAATVATQARDIALADAKLTVSTVSNLEVDIETYNGKKVYDVDFKTSSMSYDYKVDLTTGKILDKKTKTIQTTASSSSSKKTTTSPATTTTTPATSTTSQQITTTKARDIALADAKLALSAISKLDIEKDTYNGKKVYDVEFKSTTMSYEYKIDVTTGQILNKKTKTLKTALVTTPATSSQAAATSTQKITETKARDVALADAKLQVSQVKSLKVKQKTKKGTAIYEVEFKLGKIEYDYEIDATNGKILKREID